MFKSRVRVMRKKKLNGSKGRLRELMSRLFVALHGDIKVLEEAETLWVIADEMLDENDCDEYLDVDTVVALMKVIAFVFDKEKLKDERILNIADEISVELNNMKDC